jgi:hypothetical protein
MLLTAGCAIKYALGALGEFIGADLLFCAPCRISVIRKREQIYLLAGNGEKRTTGK